MGFLENKHLFWDTNTDTLDVQVNKQSIIERVLERGSWSELKELIQLYGREQICIAAKNARWFSEHTMHFVSGYFEIPLENMRCYKEKQLNPIPYL
ncbi:MAG TPA: hypothetical protein PKE63_01615 [Lacibacter sp.]|nr:hypothetical protein [Lacibacter sp.]HMO88861.1 hypothetical protein [Lacibacter sp.]HMP85941.1 hypothetical protein [Lacibacter sp.]